MVAAGLRGASSGPVLRTGGRVLVLDPDNRLLLVHERADGDRTHWLTPGGGVEPGESPAEAAVREVYEEVGLRVTLGSDQPVLVTRRSWSWAGTTYDQTDHFFWARVGADPPLRATGLTPMEEETVLGHAWWTPHELLGTSQTLMPSDLGDVVRDLLDDRHPKCN